MADRGNSMKLSAPKPITWGIAAITGSAGLLFHYHILKVAFLEPYGFWMLIFASLLLVLGCLVDAL